MCICWSTRINKCDRQKCVCEQVGAYIGGERARESSYIYWELVDE
jgi:hypothetical protein